MAKLELDVRESNIYLYMEPSILSMHLILATPSVPNYNSFDFFDPKFDHLSYSKNLCKHSQI